MIARTGAARSRRAVVAVLVAALGTFAASRAVAQCVGDCNGDGMVAINELIIGVNIALGSQPVAACPSFANNEGEVTIAQLIKGVNNALDGCPAADTPTATASATRPAATATSTRTATATNPPSATASPTATATGVPTGTATATASPTATGIPTGTATATSSPTATGVPTGTATATETPPATATGTASATLPPTATPIPTDTATVPPASTATATPPATATPVDTATPTPSATLAPSATPTETAIPPGESVAGRAAIVSTGLGSVQALVGAIVSIITNDGNALTYGLDDGVGGIADVDNCPLGGTTSQSCTGPNGGPLTIALGATDCVAGGPLGGSAEFDGSISINANAGLFVKCGNPPIFFGGSFDLDSLGVHFRGPQNEPLLDVSADLGGPFTLSPNIASACLVGSLSMTLNGTLTSALPDGSGVSVQFQNTGVVIDQITFNADCVPIVYRLTFNGPATFTPMHSGLLEVWAAQVAAAAATGDSFAVTFSNFRIVQNTAASPVTVTMSGNMTSDCFGGTLGLSTFTPIAVAAGQLCPAAGVLNVTGGGTTAQITYDLGAVTVDPDNGPAQPYPSCLDPALLACSG